MHGFDLAYINAAIARTKVKRATPFTLLHSFDTATLECVGLWTHRIGRGY